MGRIHISSVLVTDLTWWQGGLHSWTGRCLLIQSEWENLDFYINASGGLGAGGFLGQRRWSFAGAPPFRGLATGGYDIFSSLYLFVALRFRGHRIILHCDNRSRVALLTNGRAPNHLLVNDPLRRIVLLRLKLGFHIQIRYIASASNSADTFPASWPIGMARDTPPLLAPNLLHPSIPLLIGVP